MVNPFTGGLDFTEEKSIFEKINKTVSSDVFGRDINENYNPVDTEYKINKHYLLKFNNLIFFCFIKNK